LPLLLDLNDHVVICMTVWFNLVLCSIRRSIGARILRWRPVW